MSITTPPRIQVLPETVANQIAAGEVVERPASVVKELVENALDAGATRIVVEVEGGGAKLVKVEDNGHGMSREDAQRAFLRQATSKIATSHDIERIATFGFRGEAIPSIASVSRFQLFTRTADADAATEILVTGGLTEHVVDVGHPIGTTILVRDLFFNVPARRKFLRTPATELTRIRQTLTAIALAHPAVGITLIADNRTLFRLPEGDTLADRILALLGDHVLDALLPLQENATHNITVTGYIAKVDFIRGGTPEQFIFINHRPATAPQIQYALREAWPKKDHRPVAILFIDLPPEEVDVNVHPAKREVRFRHGQWVTDAVMNAVHRALSNGPMQSHVALASDLQATLLQGTPSDPAQTTRPASPTTLAPLSPIAPMPTPQVPKPAPAPVTPAPRQTEFILPTPTLNDYPTMRDVPTTTLAPFQPPPPPPTLQPPTTQQSPWQWARIADISNKGFWLVVTDQGYVTIDAKSAIERILYERLSSQVDTLPSQALLLPETIHLPPEDADRVLRYLPELEACGFGISSFGNDTFMIDALPTLLSTCAPTTLLADIAHELDATGKTKNLDSWRRELVARCAAQAAAQTLKTDTMEEATRLMNELAACEMPYTTPRGRPTMILTTYSELYRRFRRS